LSGALFNKDIGSFITNTKKKMIVSDTNGPQEYVATIPTQGRGGVINGVELQYQQTFGHFGTIVNYTYVDGKGETEDGQKIDLPGTSRNSYNLTGYYENDMFSVRAAYTHRSEFLAEGLGIGGTYLYDPQSFLDLSAVWHVTSYFDLTLDGVNVLDEQTIQKHGGGLKTFSLVNENGTRYNVKASFKF
jgi:iron complex outermembrane recepter protein